MKIFILLSNASRVVKNAYISNLTHFSLKVSISIKEEWKVTILIQFFCFFYMSNSYVTTKVHREVLLDANQLAESDALAQFIWYQGVLYHHNSSSLNHLWIENVAIIQHSSTMLSLQLHKIEHLINTRWKRWWKFVVNIERISLRHGIVKQCSLWY